MVWCAWPITAAWKGGSWNRVGFSQLVVLLISRSCSGIILGCFWLVVGLVGCSWTRFALLPKSSGLLKQNLGSCCLFIVFWTCHMLTKQTFCAVKEVYLLTANVDHSNSCSEIRSMDAFYLRWRTNWPYQAWHVLGSFGLNTEQGSHVPQWIWHYLVLINTDTSATPLIGLSNPATYKF